MAAAYLAEDTAQVAAAEKYTARAVVALDERLFAKMRCYSSHLDRLGPNQAHTRLLVAINATQARAEVAFTQMSIGQRPLLGGIYRRKPLVARDVIIEEVGWRKVQTATRRGAHWL